MTWVWLLVSGRRHSQGKDSGEGKEQGPLGQMVNAPAVAVWAWRDFLARDVRQEVGGWEQGPRVGLLVSTEDRLYSKVVEVG